MKINRTQNGSLLIAMQNEQAEVSHVLFEKSFVCA